jgi:hypothetical protein
MADYFTITADEIPLGEWHVYQVYWTPEGELRTVDGQVIKDTLPKGGALLTCRALFSRNLTREEYNILTTAETGGGDE